MSVFVASVECFVSHLEIYILRRVALRGLCRIKLYPLLWWKLPAMRVTPFLQLILKMFFDMMGITQIL